MTRSLAAALQAAQGARPYTRAQKRNIRAQKALKGPSKSSQASQEQIQKLIEAAKALDQEKAERRLDAARKAENQTGTKDLHKNKFIPLRATRNPGIPSILKTTKLALPAYPRKVSQAFAKSTNPKLVNLQQLAKVPTVFPHFEPDPPPPRPPAHDPTKQMAEFEARLRQVVADADAAKAAKESQTKVDYFVSLMV